MKRKFSDTVKNQYIRFLYSVCLVVCSALLQVCVIQVFMNPCNLLSSGFTGVSILISKITALFGIDFSVSLGILILNIPCALLCYKGVSKRFTILSCIQFTLVSFFLKVCHFESFFDDRMLNVLFGGFLYGSAIVLSLKADGSTGGTDFITLYIANKIHKSTWNYVFLFNASMLVIFGAIFGWVNAGYSIIFQFISTQTISYFHNRYEQVTLEITTTNPDQIAEVFIKNSKHGMSIIRAYGAYSKKPFYICKSVISSYEESEIINCILDVAPDVIINCYKTNHFYGNFYHKPIE